MDIKITLLPQSESVYMISGKFSESDSIVTSAENVVYLTVLPLSASYLPYTVKLIGVRAEGELAAMCKIDDEHYALLLGGRNFVFSPSHKHIPDDVCRRFFYCVKGGHFAFACDLLGKNLKNELGERELTAFFENYTDLIAVDKVHYAVDKNGVCHRCDFELRDGKIENISLDG